MFRIETKSKVICERIEAGEFSIGKFRIFAETGGYAGVWIPIMVRIKDVCLRLSAFCNSGFGYIDIPRSRTPLISLPIALLLLKDIVKPRRALEIIFYGEEIFELDNIRHVDVCLDAGREKKQWIEAEVYGNIKLLGKVIINMPLMKGIGVGFRSEDWEDGLWYFLDNPDIKKKSVRPLHFMYEAPL